MTAGPGADAAGALGPKLRLLVSAVKPWVTQVGASVPPLFTRVRVTTVVPALKLAWFEQQSPKMLNSAVFHCCSRLSTLSTAAAAALPPADISRTLSVPPATLPLRVVPCSCAAVTAGAGALTELKKQLLPCWIHG